MKRWEAARALKRCPLPPPERFVYLWLLEHADNVGGAIPERMTPTVANLAQWTGLSRATVYRALAHLERHRWLTRKSGRGRGHRSRYQLTPDVADADCHCEGKSLTVRPINERKGLTGATEKVSRHFTEPSEALGQKHLRTKGTEGVVVKGVCRACERAMPDWVLESRDGLCIDCHRRAVS